MAGLAEIAKARLADEEALLGESDPLGELRADTPTLHHIARAAKLGPLLQPRPLEPLDDMAAVADLGANGPAEGLYAAILVEVAEEPRADLLRRARRATGRRQVAGVGLRAAGCVGLRSGKVGSVGALSLWV